MEQTVSGNWSERIELLRSIEVQRFSSVDEVIQSWQGQVFVGQSVGRIEHPVVQVNLRPWHAVTVATTRDASAFTLIDVAAAVDLMDADIEADIRGGDFTCRHFVSDRYIIIVRRHDKSIVVGHTNGVCPVVVAVNKLNVVVAGRQQVCLRTNTLNRGKISGLG